MISTATTEFTAAMLGWPLRTIEAAVPPERARLQLGEIRVRQLDHAGLDRRQPVAPRDPEGLVLQRDGDRGQAADFHARRRPLSAVVSGRRRTRAGGDLPADRCHPNRGCLRSADQVRRPRRRAGGDGAAAPPRRGQARRRGRLAVHRRSSPASDRGRRGRTSGTSADRLQRCTTSPARSAPS